MLSKFINQITWFGLAVIILITVLCVTFFASTDTKTTIKNNTSDQFNTEVKEMEYSLKKRIDAYNSILYSLQGLFAASNSVERDQWNRFVKTSRIDQYPDIDFISFVQIVSDKEKETFVKQFVNDKSIRAQGYPDFKIYPVGKRGEYAIVKYTYPESIEAIKAYGIDVYTSPERLVALQKARDNNEHVASKKISIIPDNLDGFIVAAPIYRNGLPKTTLNEKRASIVGYVVAVIKIENLFKNIFSSKSSHSDIAFAVYDGSDVKSPNDSRLFYTSDGGKFSRSATYNPEFFQTKTIEVGKRIWTIRFVGTPDFGAFFVRILPWAIILGGTSLSIMLFLIFYLQSRRAKEKITASEYRYKRLFEAAQDGILILDAYSGKIVDVNPYLTELLGYKKEEIIGKKLWEIGVFKNITASKADFQQLQTKKCTIRYEDLPLQTKNGRSVNVEFINSIYDVENKKVVQCNIRDISQRKKYEELLAKTMRALKTISRCNEILVHSTNEMELLKNICKTAVDIGGYKMAWVGYAENDKNKSVRLLQKAGIEEGYLESANIVWSDTKHGRGPTGTAIRTGKICIENNMQTDPKYAPWSKEALKRGYASSIALPFKVNDTVGAFMIYAVEPDAFEKEEVSLLSELSENLSFGIKTIRSTTERKKAEEALRLAYAYNRSLIEASLDPLVTIGPDGKITDVNLATELATGFKRKDLINTDFSCYFTSPEDAKKGYKQVFNNGFVKDYPLQMRNINGKITPVLYNASVYKDEKGKVIGIFAAARDISERKKAEEDIKIRNKKLEQLNKMQEDTKNAMLNVVDDLEIAKSRIETEKIQAEAMLASIGDGVVATDSQAKIIIMNKSAASMLHCKISEVLGKNCSDIWNVEDNNGQVVPVNKRPIQLALSSAKIINTTNYYVRKDKTKFPVARTVTPVIINGEVIGAIDVFRDITRENEVDKEKTEFVSLASHQLRTPLGIAKWYLEAVRGDNYFKNAPKIVSGYLNEVYKSNERVLALVRDLLSVSRIDQGRVKDNPKQTDVIQLIKDIVKEMNIMAVKQNIKLDLIINSQSLPTVFIDSLRLHEVMENLITNAIEFNVPSGVVKVIVDKKTDDMLLISIKDTGIGLSAEDQKKLFTKFFRSQKGSIQKTEGSGLGLYVVKSYVEGWGGKVHVESKEGKGSIFTITIPFKIEKNRGEVDKVEKDSSR